MGLFSCLCSMLFPTDLQPSTDFFNVVISSFVLAGISLASLVFLIYLLFSVTLPWYPKFESNHRNYQNLHNVQNNKHGKKVHFADDVKDGDDNSNHITDLCTTADGEQLFINGYLQGYRDGQEDKKPVYTRSDSWKEASEQALEHIRQSFVHDEEEMRRAMLRGR